MSGVSQSAIVSNLTGGEKRTKSPYR